jgi:hypothetical protein
MAGEETNPLGAWAMYLGHTEYRIYGTIQPSTVASFVSSGVGGCLSFSEFCWQNLIPLLAARSDLV